MASTILKQLLTPLKKFTDDTGIGEDLQSLGRYLNAELVEVQIWTRALQAAEIEALYNLLKPSQPTSSDSDRSATRSNL